MNKGLTQSDVVGISLLDEINVKQAARWPEVLIVKPYKISERRELPECKGTRDSAGKPSNGCLAVVRAELQGFLEVRCRGPRSGQWIALVLTRAAGVLKRIAGEGVAVLVVPQDRALARLKGPAGS